MSKRSTDRPTERSDEREREENKPRKTKKKIHKRHAQSWIEFNGSRIFSFSCTFSSVLIICFPLFRLIFPVENVTVIHRMHCPRASYRLLHKKQTAAVAVAAAQSKKENNIKSTHKSAATSDERAGSIYYLIFVERWYDAFNHLLLLLLLNVQPAIFISLQEYGIHFAIRITFVFCFCSLSLSFSLSFSLSPSVHCIPFFCVAHIYYWKWNGKWKWKWHCLWDHSLTLVRLSLSFLLALHVASGDFLEMSKCSRRAANIRYIRHSTHNQKQQHFKT